MKNKKIIIGSILLLAIVGFIYFGKKREELKPYTDAELDNALNEFINKVKNYLKSKQNSVEIKANDEILPSLKYKFEQAKLKGKDFSRKNVNHILYLLYIDSLVREGDVSQGVLSVNELEELLDFLGADFYKYYANK